MPLITQTYDSLPYIDADPTPAQRTAAQSLIDAELGTSTPQTTPHPSLPELLPSQLTPLLESEYTRLAAAVPISGIDLTRYEALEPPTTSPHSDRNSPESLGQWRAALSTAYTSSVYLSGRTATLGALDKSGKEEWLAGNEELVKILEGVERELAGRKEDIDRVVVERQRAQESVSGEMQGLERAWREGVGRVLETEVAAEALRGEILARRREGAL